MCYKGRSSVVSAAAWKDTLIRNCLMLYYVIRRTLHDGCVS